MWRRRRIPIVKRIRIGRFNQRIPPVNPRLIEANRLFDSGEFSSAAAIFQELAEGSLRRDGPHAPHLFALAAKAWLQGMQMENAMGAFQKSLDILIVRKNWRRLRILSERALAQLKDSGNVEQERDLRSWLETRIPADIKNLPAWNSVQPANSIHRDLPSNCPRCGAPIEVDDLEWTNGKANCNYCGSLLSGG